MAASPRSVHSRSTPSTTSPSPPAQVPPPNPLKRKENPDDRESKPLTSTTPLPTSHSHHQGEYETGRVICEVCGGGVSFRDDETGGFTLKHWDAHRLTCVAPGPCSGETVIYTPESTAAALAHPPAKRRRAKRTEDERIDYLRADPYVAQFEAYRVLCASCDKWIRLRPNSTYCSIPWDAHRKSCLSKKINSKNVYALEERNNLFAKDTDVRKFDAERVLCNICDKWMSVPPDDHLQAVQKWLQHRASCQKSAMAMLHPEGGGSRGPPSPPPAQHEFPSGPVSSSSSPAQQYRSPSSRPASPSYRLSPAYHHHPYPSQPRYQHSDTPSFHDLTPSNYAPAHESRRRNAEQRAATLRADNLIAKVEPNRVFCSLCQKWVQLRQDSSYCAYPWLQHRGKCLARHQRRQKKAGGSPERHHRRPEHKVYEDQASGEGHHIGGAGDRSEDAESDSDDSQNDEDRARIAEAKSERHNNNDSHIVHPVSSSRTAHSSYPRGHATTPHSASRAARSWENDGGNGEQAGKAGDSLVHGQQAHHPHHHHHPNTPSYRPSLPRTPSRRPWSSVFADLDSSSGRRQFIFSSVEHLFSSTYESSDDMPVSALLTYLNAAMPQDKHEDFDTSEVVRAVAAMAEKGRIVFEGDMIRLRE